jgi:hypothetical protein
VLHEAGSINVRGELGAMIAKACATSGGEGKLELQKRMFTVQRVERLLRGQLLRLLGVPSYDQLRCRDLVERND